MSGLSQQLALAINSAKRSMGDLVVPATLKKIGTRTYVNGQYINTTVDVPIDGVLDKFDYMELQSPEFNQNDLKFNVFNPLNDLNISNADSVLLNGVLYAVNRLSKVYVGVLVPMITLYLRK